MKLDNQHLQGVSTMVPSDIDENRRPAPGVVLEYRDVPFWRRTDPVAASMVMRDPSFVIDPDTGNS